MYLVTSDVAAITDITDGKNVKIYIFIVHMYLEARSRILLTSTLRNLIDC